MKIGVVILMVLALTFAGCEGGMNRVAFLVDEGFSGLIVVREDVKGTDKTHIEDRGVIVLDARGKGELSLQSTDFFQTWHSLEARYPSGTNIYGVTQPGVASVIRLLFVTSSGEIFVYIGPESGVEEARMKAEESLVETE